MSSLLSRKHAPDSKGCIQKITPESAGWNYVGFEVFMLKSGESLKQETGVREVCLVLVSGKANVKSLHKSWENQGERLKIFGSKSVAEGRPPYAVYVPNNDEFVVVALTDLELAVCSAPGLGNFPAMLIKPGDMTYETRGH